MAQTVEWRFDRDQPAAGAAADTTDAPGADAEDCVEGVAVTMTPEQSATARDLLAALYFARNAYAEAERIKERCERAVREFLDEIESQTIESEEHLFTAT